MNNLPIVLDGSKFDWFTGDRDEHHGLGFTGDHPRFPKGGRPPAQVIVRSPRTGAVVAFDFVEVAEDDDGEQTLNYQGTLPDGRRCTLALAAG